MHSAEYLTGNSRGHKLRQVVVQGGGVVDCFVGYPNYAEEQGHEVHWEGLGCF